MLRPSFLNFSSVNFDSVQQLFSLALQIEKKRLDEQASGISLAARASSSRLSSYVAALLFFEPSTRTRASFQTAVYRSGGEAIVFEGAKGNSLEKGESVEDTILNIAAMKPDVMIVRCQDHVDLKALAERTQIPILNAGWGVYGHPTQALLDCFTLQKRWGNLANKKILFVGDIRHSRVAASNFELLKILGAEVAVAGPEQWLPQDTSGKIVFNNLAEALRWCDAVMALRVQVERHAMMHPMSEGGMYSLDNHVHDMSAWQLNAITLKSLSADALILHPGPVNWGVELAEEVQSDKRNCILEQVYNGTLIREALIRKTLQLELK